MHSIEASPASKWGINFILRTKCMRKSLPTPCSAECKCRTPLASLKAGRCRTVELFACHRAYRIFPVRHGAAAKTSDLWARGVSDANVSCNPGLSKPSNDGDHSIVPPPAPAVQLFVAAIASSVCVEGVIAALGHTAAQGSVVRTGAAGYC